jgi:hypothetical protein
VTEARDAAGLDWDPRTSPHSSPGTPVTARPAAAIVAAVCVHRGHDQTQDDVTVFVLRRSA